MSDLPAVPLDCLEGILDIMDVAVACTDLEGWVMVWNRASEELSGWNREEMVGSTVDRVVPPSGWEERKKAVARTLAEGQAAGTYSRVRKDGTILHIEMDMRLIRDKQGEPHCIVALVKPLPGHGVSLSPRQKRTNPTLKCLPNTRFGVVVHNFSPWMTTRQPARSQDSTSSRSSSGNVS